MRIYLPVVHNMLSMNTFTWTISYKHMYYSALLVILVAYKSLQQIKSNVGCIWGASKANAPDNLFLLVIMLKYN